MFFDNPFSANTVPTFPANTVCLTYDDGPSEVDSPPTEPGPHSLELAQYLADQGVQATFFMVGRWIEQIPDVAAQMSALGHQVGIHTYDHFGLDDYLKAGGDIVRQMSLTSALVPRDVTYPLYLRAPYGQWTPAVAQVFNADFLTCMSCFGPIHWDNNTSDWDKWANDVPAQDVANQYFAELNALRRGIVLMHDNTANNGQLRLKNMGYMLTQFLVPQLKAAGFNFARVDAIPGIAAQAGTAPAFALKGNNSLYVSPQNGGGGDILVSGAAPSTWERLTTVALSGNRFALRAPGGQYFSVQNVGGNPVTATATDIGDWETFDAVPYKNGTTVFRTITGGFLTIGGSNVLSAIGDSTDLPAEFSLFLYPAATAAITT